MVAWSSLGQQHRVDEGDHAVVCLDVGTGDVAAQLLQRLAVFSPATHGSVKTEAVEVDAQPLLDVLFAGQSALQCQHLLPGARSEGDAVSLPRVNRPLCRLLMCAFGGGPANRCLCAGPTGSFGAPSSRLRMALMGRQFQFG